MFSTEAKVQVKNTKNEVIASQTYQKVVFEGTAKNDKGEVISAVKEDVLLGDAIKFMQKEVGEKGNGVIELLRNVTYAYDLGVRAGIRQTLVTAAAGPDKAIEKAIKDFMAARAAAGKPVTLEQATERIKLLMDAE